VAEVLPVKSDRWKTFNLSVASALGLLGAGYVLTAPLDRAPAEQATPVMPPSATVASSRFEPADLAGARIVDTTVTPATSIDVALLTGVPSSPTAPPQTTTTVRPMASAATTTTAATAVPAEAAVPLVPLASTTTTSTTTTVATTTTTTTSAPEPDAPDAPDEQPSCLLRLWDPIAQEWFCLL
jgi:hypothetical protein